METNVFLVDTTAFKAAVPMKVGRWVRFPHVSAKISIFKIILINFYLISFSFGQGMYVEKISEQYIH